MKPVRINRVTMVELTRWFDRTDVGDCNVWMNT